MENNQFLLKELFRDYPEFKEEQLQGRYVNFDTLKKPLEKIGEKYEVSEIGKSVRGVPIHAIYLGRGKKRILAWSQMHGNESTTTKAIFDLLNAFTKFNKNQELQKILQNCSICIIPLLNPDGAKIYMRENANGIDLNRDAQGKSQPESRVLWEQFLKFKPDYCFNLHDQRTIYSAGKNRLPATLSFLTPAMDEECSPTPSRKQSMALIAAIAKNMEFYIPGQIGRYDDGFNINCTGDTIQSQNVPTVLFEAGHFAGDYLREETRKYVCFSILTALIVISEGNIDRFTEKHYFDIPENKKLFYDLIFRDFEINGERMDVAFQFDEKLEDDIIKFIPVISKIRKILNFYGHTEIDCRNSKVRIFAKHVLNENVVVDKILVNNEIFTII